MHRKNTIYLFICLTILLGGFSASQLVMETDINAYNLASEEDIKEYETFVGQVGIDSTQLSIIIAEKTDGWQTAEDFRKLKSLTAFWKSQKEVKAVYSVVDLEYPKRGLLRVRKEPFLDLNNPERLQQRLNAYESYADVFEKFLSRNKQYALIFIDIEGEIPIGLAKDFERKVADAQKLKIHFLQYDLIEKELQSYLKKDTILLGAFSLLLILISFYLFTYSLRGIGLIALMVLFNVSATFTSMWWLGMNFTMHMITIPCIIIVLSFTDIMHILYHQHQLSPMMETDEQLRGKILQAVQKPLLFTSLTNIIGLLVFLFFSENIHLYNYSLASILGVAFAYLSSRFLVIGLMDRESIYLRRKDFKQLLRLHQLVAEKFWQRRKVILPLFIAGNMALVAVIWSAFEVDSNAGKDFSIENAALTNGKQILEHAFFGEKQGEIFIKIQNEDIWDKATLQKIERVEDSIRSCFSPLYINSPVLLVKRYHRFMQNGRIEAFTLPRKLGKAFVRGLRKHKNSLVGVGIVADNSQQARIIFGYRDMPLSIVRERYAQILKVLKSEEDDKLSFELNGLQYLSDEATYDFSHKILLGFGLSILFSSIFMVFLLKSAKVGLGVLLVNSFPIFVALGIIIWMEISITPLTLFLLSILLGVCVDDSIYIVSQNRQKANAIHIIPIFITSLVLAFGFMALSFSSFVWLQPFGWIFMMGIIMAYLLDSFILTLFLNQTSSFGDNG